MGISLIALSWLNECLYFKEIRPQVVGLNFHKMRSVLWIPGHTPWINDWRYYLQFEFGMNAFQYLSFHKVRKTKSMILKSGIDQLELTNITIRTRGRIYLLSKRIPWKTDIELRTKQINKSKTRYQVADIGVMCNSIKVY